MIGYLPENNPLYHDMPVIDYLEFVAGIQGIPKEQILPRVVEMIRVTGLNQEKHKRIGELSKGFRQRVGLAQALIHDPEILILDEPTSGLDPNQIVEIRKLIIELGRHKTVILSTHILPEVEATCDRIMIINQGRIVADGALELGLHGWGPNVAEIRLIIGSKHQKRGLGSAIMRELHFKAAEHKVDRIVARFMAPQTGARHILTRLFTLLK